MSKEKHELQQLATKYVNADFALVPIPKGSKAPNKSGWNISSNTIQSIEHIKGLSDCNIGLAHAYSGTCCIDIDDLKLAIGFFSEHNINLIELLMAGDAVQIKSGKDNHAKLLYRIDKPITSFQYKQDNQVVVEFRCATSNGKTVQDVLPPSIHPDTNNPYEWYGDFNNIPTIPREVLELWNNFFDEPKSYKKPYNHRNNITPMVNPITSMVVFDRSNKSNVKNTNVEAISSPINQQQIKSLYMDVEIQHHLLLFLGFQKFDHLFTHGKTSVYCTLRDDNNKSGGLIIGEENGQVLYHDYAGTYGDKYLSLPEVYAKFIAGGSMSLKPVHSPNGKKGSVTAAVWGLRLLVDAGIVSAARVDMPDCPTGANKTIHKVHAGIKHLFAVRWAYSTHYGNSLTLGRKFLMDWCNVTENQARSSIKYLLKHCIHTAGSHTSRFGKAHTFLPGFKPEKI